MEEHQSDNQESVLCSYQSIDTPARQGKPTARSIKRAVLRFLFSVLLVPWAMCAAENAVAFDCSAAGYSGGDGLSVDTAYQISSARDLICLKQRDGDWDKHFIQTADIDFGSDPAAVDWNGDGDLADPMNSMGFSPIGYISVPFTGSYNGNSKTVSNLYINRLGDSRGLFGWVSGAGSIKNLGLINVDINSESPVGALAGTNKGGQIDNCYATGKVTGSEKVGGLVGESDGTVMNSYAAVDVTGGINSGGLVGLNRNIVTDSYATGTVAGSSQTGGLIGENNQGTISRSYATGAVTERDASSQLGGLVGLNRGSITSCYAAGAVIGSSQIGGLVGYNSNDVLNCYATGAVTGGEIGGLVGTNDPDNGRIANSFSTGVVAEGMFNGGLIGGFFPDGVITSSYWDITTSGLSTSGAGGAGITTSQFYSTNPDFDATFSDWDFSNHWVAHEDDYPSLSWENPAAQASTNMAPVYILLLQ